MFVIVKLKSGFVFFNRVHRTQRDAGGENTLGYWVFSSRYPSCVKAALLMQKWPMAGHPTKSTQLWRSFFFLDVKRKMGVMEKRSLRTQLCWRQQRGVKAQKKGKLEEKKLSLEKVCEGGNGDENPHFLRVWCVLVKVWLCENDWKGDWMYVLVTVLKNHVKEMAVDGRQGAESLVLMVISEVLKEVKWEGKQNKKKI